MLYLAIDQHKNQMTINIAVLSDEEIDAVCAFLDNGGNLVVSGVTATLNFDGEPSGNDKLWKKIGLKLSQETRGWNGHNYIRLPEGERHDIFAGFENTDILPFGGTVRKVESTGTLSPLGALILDFTAYPPEFSWIREVDTSAPPILAGTLPSGGRVVYLAGTIDRSAARTGLPDQARLLANVVRWAANGSIPLEIDGQGQLDCKIYRQDNRLIVHLVNVTGTERRGYLDSLLAVGPFTVAIDAQGLAPKQAFRTVEGGTVPIKFENGKVRISIDKIIDHEMLVIE